MRDNKVGFLTATALVVANMIGTGVFTSLGFQVGPLPSVPILIILWLCGGLVALCGGLSYIQLAKLFPDSGGEYYYIREKYHKGFAHVAGLVSVFAGFSAPAALAVMAFCVYFAQIVPALPHQLTALMVISFITLIHCFSIRLSGGFQLIATIIKVVLVLLFIGVGLYVPASGSSTFLKHTDFSMITSSGFGSSLIYVSFAYSGWNACVYIFHEIRDPQRNISRSIIVGTLLVTALYMLLNYIFLKTVPLKQLDGVVEVGAVAANKIFGQMGGNIIATLISLLLVSTISAMVWTGSRVISKMMTDISGSSGKSQKKKVPILPILIQYLITVVLIISNTFQQILMFTSILLIVSSSLAVAILFIEHSKIKPIHLIPAGIYLLANLYAIFILLF